jgi:hypothetical protein
VMALLLAGCSGASTRASAATKPSNQPPLPTVDTKATPPGWVPLDYGDAQISVPSTWVIATLDCPGMYQGEGWISLAGITKLSGCPLETRLPPNVVFVQHDDDTSIPSSYNSTPSTVNGFEVYSSLGGCKTTGGMCPKSYLVPRLGLMLRLQGLDSAAVLNTLTYSPRSVALAPGSSPAAPKSWHRVFFGHISAYVPKSWPVESFGWGGCPTNGPGSWA